MRAFLEHHLRAYRLRTLFDAPRLDEAIRFAFTLIPAVGGPVGAGAAVLVFLSDRRTGLLFLALMAAVLGLLSLIQLRRDLPNPTALYVGAATLIAFSALFGDAELFPGVVAGFAVASTACFTLVEGRRRGLVPLLVTTLLLGITLYLAAPNARTLIGIGVLIAAEVVMWLLIGMVAEEIRFLGARFRALVDHSTSGVMIVGRDGTIDFINDAGRQLLGPVDGRQASETIDLAVLGDRDTMTTIRSSDGESIPVLARCSELKVEATSLQVAVFTDQRKRLAEQDRLAESEAQYRRLFDRVPVGLYTSTPAGAIIQANQAFAEMFGYGSPEEVSTVRVEDLFVDAERRREIQESLISEGALTAEFRLRRKDGSVMWVRDSSSLERDENGEPMYNHGELTDITIERRANEEMRATIAERERLVAAVAHELRTPLTSVLGLSQLLADGELPESEMQEVHGILVTQSKDLAFIVEDLLAVSQLTHGRIGVSPREIELEPAVNDTVEMIDLGDREVTVRVSPDSRALADPIRVRQVIRNLLTNVAKYGGRRVEVVVDEVGGEVLVSVADDGSGLGAATDEAFEAYRRLHLDSTDHGSLGLGLTLSRGLADAMGGSLTYHHDGTWARFTLTLPAVDREESTFATST